MIHLASGVMPGVSSSPLLKQVRWPGIVVALPESMCLGCAHEHVVIFYHPDLSVQNYFHTENLFGAGVWLHFGIMSPFTDLFMVRSVVVTS